jgi:hypothetical protein
MVMNGYPRLRRLLGWLCRPPVCSLWLAVARRTPTRAILRKRPRRLVQSKPRWSPCTVLGALLESTTPGLCGPTVRVTFRRLQPRAVLRIASSPAFKAIEPIKPTHVCCDFFRYTLTVTYSDGSHTRLQTDDSSPQPAALTRLLSFFG